ncbi:MAG: formate C-acetyltransferase [Bacillota bacterium]|jgi:formate C-acetyltransferase|nr:formate C-acetyltransferase [Bacillota bacterium]HOA90219.1 formate C-acetyltransferase [Bacillota bacterium]HPZ73391.1 formate C-acetyltransferase [Bacillota bacterium]HQD78214.1 formate C-acetyltransferase [Bacillota bacterium]
MKQNLFDREEMAKAWEGFVPGNWSEEIDVRDFIQKNYTPYLGDQSFLEGPTDDTKSLWNKVDEMIQEEVRSKTIKVDLERFSGIDNFAPGYIDKDRELIVGLQTDEPLKRIMNPYGGFRMVKNALEAYGMEMDPDLEQKFNEYRKTHNQGVFDAYTKEMRTVRSVGLLTGLPDAYGRGRIIGDYRRVPLYGVDYLKEMRIRDKENLTGPATDEVIRLREEFTDQIRALDAMKSMAAKYGCDIGRPARNAQEAVQWLYLAYLAAVKENNGAAMSFGRNTAFIDIYIERDLQKGLIDEKTAQALVDQLVIKLRLVRHLRTPEYDQLFAGDPTWVTEAIGGIGLDGRPLVTKTAYRFLHTLTNLGTSPEPNMTVLWSKDLPREFKEYCAYMSIKTASIQYENDDLMRPIYGDDYAIACCVSAMRVGKDMQFFGARANLAKALLYAINGGVDEIKRDKVTGGPITVISGIEKNTEEVLSYDTVVESFKKVMDKLAEIYVNTMNTIHYMHDKYAYEASQLALHDPDVHRFIAFGVAGLSIVADSLSAIKYAKVKPIRNEEGIAIDFEIEGDFPRYGNDDDRVDSIAVEVNKYFIEALRRHPAYRNAEHTLSLLTITSNVIYGKKTGTTPDGRKKGEPFAPGANPSNGADKLGALASLNSVAKLPYKGVNQDGISNTFSIVPSALGKNLDERVVNLTNIMEGYFNQNAFHINVNVLDKDLLIDAMENPEKYPNLTIRVSGYAVRFNQLDREHQLDVINRTFHEFV